MSTQTTVFARSLVTLHTVVRAYADRATKESTNILVDVEA